MPGLESPPAPPAGVKIVQPSTPPKPPPAPTREIKLGQPSRPSMVDQLKPSAAKQSVSNALYKKAGAEVPKSEEPQTPPPAPAPDPANRPGDIEAPEAPETTETPSTETPQPSTETPKPQSKTKTNPWKVVDDYKKRTADLEKQLAEVKTKPLADQQKGEYLTKIEALQKQNEDLENRMRFIDYSQSTEFKQKYQAPYEKAFQAAVQEMGELNITDPNTGAVRQVTAQDIVALANLPLADARKMANDLYGDFADDMMAHRKEIRKLYQVREEALKEARENGGKRIKEQQELTQKQQAEVQEYIKSTWTAVNAQATKNEKYGKYFTPIEGDQDGNQRLAKGYELVDRAFSENPNDPSLTPDQRKGIIERHAAVRNRAAAAGRLIAWLHQRDAEIAELKKKLGGYQGSEPTTGGAPAYDGNGHEPARATDRVMAALRAKAR